MSDFNHLNVTAREWIDLPKLERINLMKQDHWVGYTQAKLVLDQMDELFHHPRINRMPNMLLIGRSNNGKSQILKRFEKLHPALDNLEADAISVPVLYIQAPSVPDEKRFYIDILDKIFARYTYSHHPHQLLKNVIDKFEKIGVRVLIIDEIHNLLAGALSKQRQFLTTIKYLSNELQISIVAAGTEDAVRAIQTDGQLANRFPVTTLPRWTLDTEFKRLLVSYEKILPLKKQSNLIDPILANEIHTNSDGTIGSIVNILKEAAELAIKMDHEKIDIDILRESLKRSAVSRQKARTLDI